MYVTIAVSNWRLGPRPIAEIKSVAMHRFAWAALPLLLAGPGQAPAAQQSPGEVILLALRQPDEANASLATAISDPNPLNRLAAARVAGVNHDRKLTPRLLEALAAETSDMVAAEQARALFLLEGEAARALVAAHVERIGGVSSIAVAEWLARNRPGDFAGELTTLARATPRGATLLIPLVAYAARDAEARHEILSAWMNVTTAPEWRSVLDRVLIDDETLRSSAAALGAALGSELPQIREETVWFVVVALGRGDRIPKEVIDAALPRGEASSKVDWETFGRELVARQAMKVRPNDRSEFLRSSPSHRRLVDWQVIPSLTSGERDVAKEAFPPLGRRGNTTVPSSGPGMDVRTVSEWMPGIIDQSASAAGCTVPESPRFGFARVTYDDRGRVTRAEVDSKELSQECRSVLIALARTGLADPDRPLEAGQQQWQVLPLSRSFVECTSRPAGESRRVGSEAGGETIRPPRKTKDVRPEYPADLLQKRVQGTVYTEAVIADTGCVRSLRIVKSSGALGLDLAAIRSVSGWVFEPAQVAGRPTAVHMTVTVNFSVR